MPNVRLAIGSNAASIWWVNGEEPIGIYGDRQTVIDDGVSKRITLKKEQNIVRAAVVKVGGATDFCARFLDPNDEPLMGYTVNAAEARKEALEEAKMRTLLPRELRALPASIEQELSAMNSLRVLAAVALALAGLSSIATALPAAGRRGKGGPAVVSPEVSSAERVDVCAACRPRGKGVVR